MLCWFAVGKLWMLWHLALRLGLLVVVNGALDLGYSFGFDWRRCDGGGPAVPLGRGRAVSVQ